MRKYVIDANLYIDAAEHTAERSALEEFSTWAAPRLYLSSVVAAELVAGAGTEKDRRILESSLFGPLVRRGRVVTPSGAAWDALGLTLSRLRTSQGLETTRVRRSFAFDVLLAYSCREAGATVITRNARDMERIRRVFAFDFVAPYPSRVATP